jgi:hypothetical protein
VTGGLLQFSSFWKHAKTSRSLYGQPGVAQRKLDFQGDRIRGDGVPNGLKLNRPPVVPANSKSLSATEELSLIGGPLSVRAVSVFNSVLTFSIDAISSRGTVMAIAR